MSLFTPNKRKAGRQEPGIDEFAWVDFSENESEPFSTRQAALVMSQSQGGFGLLMFLQLPVKVGKRCRVRVGDGLPTVAEVRWVKEIQPEIITLGLQLLNQ